MPSKLNRLHNYCKDCGIEIPNVRQRARCNECGKIRQDIQKKLWKQRQIGGLPVTCRDGNITYTNEAKRVIRHMPHIPQGQELYDTEQIQRDNAFIDENDEGDWAREQFYNWKFDIPPDIETDKERRNREYKEWKYYE